MQQLATIRNERERKKKEKKKENLAALQKKNSREEAKKAEFGKVNRKKLYRLAGLAKQDAEMGRYGKKRRVD